MKRNTLAKKIREQPTTAERLNVAVWGHNLTPIQEATRLYVTQYAKREHLKRTGMAGTDPELLQTSEYCERFHEVLMQKITPCLHSLDSQCFRDIADWLDMFRSFTMAADRKRALIIKIKDELNNRGESMPIATLAEKVSERKTEDGYSALRQLCRELHFPLMKSGKVNKLKKQA